MEKTSIVKAIMAGAVIGFASFKIHGDMTDISSGITCICVGVIIALIVEVLSYLLFKKKQKTN